MKLYVGNLSFDTTENDLQDLFEQHGKVAEVALMMDRMTGKSRGFAFVTMNDTTEANAAMVAINGKELCSRALAVNETRPREERPPLSGCIKQRNYSQPLHLGRRKPRRSLSGCSPDAFPRQREPEPIKQPMKHSGPQPRSQHLNTRDPTAAKSTVGQKKAWSCPAEARP